MWSLNNYRAIFVATGLIGILLFSLPSILLFSSPREEAFSELYALDLNHKASGYPFNIRAKQPYKVYVDVGNYMGKSTYYEVVVKFRNSTESLPNATSGEASSLPAMYTYRVFLDDGHVWEALLNFSVLNVGFDGNMSSVGTVKVNGFVIDVGKVSAWDNDNDGFYYQIFVELWRYDVRTGGLGFDNRFISLWLNVTKSF